VGASASLSTREADPPCRPRRSWTGPCIMPCSDQTWCEPPERSGIASKPDRLTEH
jgi:hypothetical protein